MYNPSDHYWIVAGSTTEVYSSSRSAYVPVTDVIYLAWLNPERGPTRIVSDAELLEVLAPGIDKADLKAQATQGIADIDAYLIGADLATNIQVRAEVKAIDQRQKRIIKALRRLL